jgi:hypothetical protein
MPSVKEPPVDERVGKFRSGEKKRRTEEEEKKKEKPGDFGRGNQPGLPPNPIDWSEGRDALVQFLEDFKTILTHLVKERIVIDPTNLTKQDPLFQANLNDATKSIDEVIKELKDDKTGEKWYWPLKRVGCAGKAIWVKLRDVYDSISTKSLGVVVEVADVIIGSLAHAFPVLEPVKELKEIAEKRVKHGADKPLLTLLNLSGRELVDYNSKATSE